MKEYQVQVTVTEVGTVFVMANDYEEAIKKALSKFNDGGMEMTAEYMDADIVWAEDDECEM